MSKGVPSNEIMEVWDECLSIDPAYIPCIANRSRYNATTEEHLSCVNRLMDLDPTNTYTYFVTGNYFFEEHTDFQNAYLNYIKF